MSDIIIFTDGAAKGNPGRGGWGAVVADEKEVAEIGGHEAHTTNNRMELQAAIEALSFAQQYKTESITVYPDSEYVVNGATKWGSGWRRNGWMTKQKKPVLNRDLWEPLLELVDSFGGRIEWHVVGGHIGVRGNERVDTIADSFARGEKVQLYRGARSAYNVDLEDLSIDQEKHRARKAARPRSSKAAYSYVSAVDGVVQVHKTWKECEARVRGKMARFKKALSAAEEADIIRLFSK